MKPFYRFCQFGCRGIVTLLFNLRVYNKHHVPAEGPALLVSNHQSFLDPVLLGVGLSRELTYMARDTLFTHPHFSKLIESLNAFPVKRGHADISAIKETLRRLKQGACVTLFPEGTRTSDGSVGQFHAGVIMLAKKAHVPVVPAAIDGAFEAWPRTSPLPRHRHVRVSFAPAIPADRVSDMPADDLVYLLRTQIVDLMRHMPCNEPCEPWIGHEFRRRRQQLQ